MPNLIDIQKASFRWFMGHPSDPKSFGVSGLRETIDDISPIRDYSERLEVRLGEYTIGDPVVSERECREKDQSFEVPVNVKVSFTNLDTGEIREQTVFLGNFPWMTEQGTFIINGTERVVVTQLVRSPGAYIMEPKDATKQVFVANLMPSRGSWLEMEIDKKGMVNVRIDRKRKLPVTTLLRALPAVDENTGFEIDKSDEGLLALFGDNPFIRMTLEKDPVKSEDAALVEVFKKQRPGEPPTVENSRNLVRSLFFDPKRYDLTKVGRYKLNMRLGQNVSPDCRVLTTGDIVELIRRLVVLPVKLNVPEDSKDYAADAIIIPRTEIEHDLDEYEHFGNRRLRTVGELIQEAFRIGLYRMERVVRERLTTEDEDAITPQTIVNIRPVAAALKEFFGSSQLSQFMDQTNSLAGLTHRRRLSALGAGGLTRERAPIEVRDVHPTHYGRMCPIETPEGPNIGLMGSLGSYAKVSEHGFVQTPYRKVTKGKITGEVEYLDAIQEEMFTIAQANAEVDKNSKLVSPVLCRTRDGVPVQVDASQVDYMDVDPAQIVSVATALIPFLEHNDANRALMGSNMQRQAVPLMVPEAPLVGTGLEYRAAVDTGDVTVATRAGKVEQVDADRIIVSTRDGLDAYDLVKYRRSNQGTIIHQKPIVYEGQRVSAGEVLADGSSTDQGELALGKNLLVAFMSWEGYNFEDAIILSERIVKDDVLTSIHIHEYEVDARSTKLGDEEITRDIPNRSEESLRNLDESGIVRDRGRGRLRRPARRQGHAQGRDRAHGRGEAHPRDLQGEGARGARHLAQGAPRRGRQGHRREDLRARRRRRPVARRERARARLRRHEAQDRRGRQARRPPRQQGRDLQDRARGGHAAHGRRDARRHHPEPAGRAVAHEHRPGPRDPPRLGGPACGRERRPTSGSPRPSSTARRPRRSTSELIAWQDANKSSSIRFGIDKKGPAGGRCDGKMQLYNGRSGEPYDQPVTVGYMYILKLLHLVDDKIHARSTGPYSLVTQQPLGGKAQFGGQRFGEMEVWALEAYGAAYTLQEMLTIKSDDTIGRVKAYEAVVKGENIPEPSIPESFKVLLKEMQSLALDVKVVSVDGGDVAVREEEDELLRAAEELGIDLRPVADRAAARAPGAQELEEGVDRTDDDGELTVPNDELLGEELVEDDLDRRQDDEEEGDGEGFGDIADLELVEEAEE